MADQSGPDPYDQSLAEMEARAAAVVAGEARELVWLLEHPPVYTAGTSADPVELVDPRFPVFQTGRGGKYTYHGPGQRTGYLVLDLNKRGRDVRHFVHTLEDWLIAALGRLGVNAFRAEGRVGIWTATAAGGQGRRDRCARASLGDAARLCDQRRARSFAFRRDRALRPAGIPRHQPFCVEWRQVVGNL